jgi:cytidylate kinase
MNDSSEQPPSPGQPLVGIVGVCASGKSTLISGLVAHGIRTKHIAQEHSFVKDMWKRLTNPDILVFLDASYPVTLLRRRFNWTEADWAEQQRRLMHARDHADLIVNTNELTIEQVLELVVNFVSSHSSTSRD